MKILVINSGSSSVKYKLIDTTSGNTMAEGGVEKSVFPTDSSNTNATTVQKPFSNWARPTTKALSRLSSTCSPTPTKAASRAMPKSTQ